MFPFPRWRNAAPLFLVAGALLTTPLSAQDAHDRDHDHDHGHDHDHDHEHELVAVPMALPMLAQENLGVTFIPAEQRRVQHTRRLPGRFESLPSARAEYRSSARGRVELLVEQYQPVEVGTPLYRIESPAWRVLQRELAQAELTATLVTTQLEEARLSIAAARESVRIREDQLARILPLQQQGLSPMTEVADAYKELAEARRELAISLREEQLLKLEVLTVKEGESTRNPRFDAVLREAATLLGVQPSWLLEQEEGEVRWKTLTHMEIRARQTGVVEAIATPTGSVLMDGDLILSTVEAGAVRFRGFALQSDIVYLVDRQSVRIVPPIGTHASYAHSVTATMFLGVEADPNERTIDFLATPEAGTPLPTWARPGVAAFAEIALRGTDAPVVSVPLSSVVQDGLERILFLQDRNNPEVVYRIAPRFGASDGRWIAVLEGVSSGDHVVLDGVYELLLSSSAKPTGGGHMHSDGTFHAGEH